MTWLKMPFKYDGEKDFYQQLDDWVGDLFYDRLPEMGYETREEQIFTTFHMIKALREKRVLFAEAGSGTGKTFAYLLACLCYARQRGKPVILSSSSPVLQEQLTSPEGDIATLSKQLGLEIDARIARRQEHYACELKLEELDPADREARQLLEWGKLSQHMERSEIPDISDEAWARVAWDGSLPCDRCRERGSCRQVKSRMRFRDAKDFIICEHEVFFRDLWLRDELQSQRRLTYLPQYCAVVFDEAHLIELPLAKTLGKRLSQDSLEELLARVTDVNDQRLIVSRKVDDTMAAAHRFFQQLMASIMDDEYAERLHVRLGEQLMAAAESLISSINALQDELVIEETMNEGTPMEWILAYYQELLEIYLRGLKLLLQGEERTVTWWEPKERSAWVIPREFSHALRDQLLAKRMPIIFTSATLAAGHDFAYMHQITGAKDALRAQVGVPFDLDKQVVAYIADDLGAGSLVDQLASRIVELIEITKGKTLVLCSSAREVLQLRDVMKKRKLPYRFIWEGDAQRSKLVDDFRNDISSVLVGSEFWEGVDVPGEALSQVIIASLPFPRHDPLIEARRRDAKADGLDPFEVIDVPTMLIKLRQGFGRLIRTASDRGLISILDSRPNTDTHQLILNAIPKGVPVYTNLSDASIRVRTILG
ncbi:MAG: ATP-dependent DNA helicase [Bacillota bacterium]